MTQTAQVATRPGTVWKRALGMFVVCMVAVGLAAVALINGLIPVAFGISENPIKLTIGKLEGARMTAYVGTDPSVDGGRKPAAIAALQGGRIHSLCLSTTLDLPLVGELSVQIRSGESTPIPFSEMTAFADGMIIGDVTVRDVQLGVDGSMLGKNNLVQGPDGSWGLQFDNATVRNIKASGEQAHVGQLQLRGMGLSLKTGEHHCYTGKP